MYLLDTNILSYLFQGSTQIAKKLEKIEQEKISTCSLVVSELFFGAKNASDKKKQLRLINFYEDFIQDLRVHSFDTQSAIIFAELKYLAIKKGKTVGDFDLMIGSICLANNLTLVTNNTKHFLNIENLKLENWLND